MTVKDIKLPGFKKKVDSPPGASNPGQQGASGTDGSGPQGASGTDGSGPQGASGADGSGPQGAPGTDGSGPQGTPGAKSSRTQSSTGKGGKKKFSRRAPGILVVCVIIVLAFFLYGGFYRVSEQEAAVVTMFGNHVRTDTAGLYYRIPWLQQVQKVDTTIHGTGIGYAVNNDGQNFTLDTEGIMITSDFNLIDIDFYMEYRVSDPVAYLYNSSDPEFILKNMALAAIRSTVIDYTVDDAMTVGKSQIQAQVKSKLQDALSSNNIGLQVVNITVQDAEPPTTEIVKAFKAVETAKQGKDTAVNNAKQYQNEQIPAAEAAADKIIQTAEGKKEARIAEAEGQAARFLAMYGQYELNPLITRQRMYYETMERVLPKSKVIITDGSTETVYPLESFTGPASAQEGGE